MEFIHCKITARTPIYKGHPPGGRRGMVGGGRLTGKRETRKADGVSAVQGGERKKEGGKRRREIGKREEKRKRGEGEPEGSLCLLCELEGGGVHDLLDGLGLGVLIGLGLHLQVERLVDGQLQGVGEFAHELQGPQGAVAELAVVGDTKANGNGRWSHSPLRALKTCAGSFTSKSAPSAKAHCLGDAGRGRG